MESDSYDTKDHELNNNWFLWLVANEEWEVFVSGLGKSGGGGSKGVV